MATYDITWSITEEVDDDNFSSEEEKMIAAVQQAFSRLQAHGNDWFWKVANQKTKQEFEIDFEFATSDQGPEIIQTKL